MTFMGQFRVAQRRRAAQLIGARPHVTARAASALAAAALAAGCGNSSPPVSVPGGPGSVPERLADSSATPTPADGSTHPENPLGQTRKAKDRKPQDAALLHTLTPVRGFIDTPLAFDSAGGRLLYVNTDAADLCELVVWDLGQKTEVMRVDLKAFTTAPLSVQDVIDGEHFLVLAKGPGEGTVAGAIIDRKGAVTRKLGPATDIVTTQYDGQDAVTVYRREELAPKKKKDRPGIRHTVDVFALGSGKRLGKRAVMVTDLAGYSQKLDFKLNHWMLGYTRAVGIKGGEYDRKEDQRSPNIEAWYDVPRSTFTRTSPITDVVEHTKRLQLLAQHSNESTFLAVAPDLSGLVAYSDGAGPTPIELAEPFRHYLHTSFLLQPAQPGQPLFFTLEIDPVNPDAVERKRAEEKWLDLYMLTPGANRAARVARLPLDDDQPGYRWRARPTRWIVLPRHVGFERGGAFLLIYETGSAAPSKAGRREPQPTAPGQERSRQRARQQDQGQRPEYQARAEK
jgi:hypothetical protein